jgi:riboflavin biosynthesis pyrimidine reductase
MIHVHGPGAPFITLFDEQEQIGTTLPDAFQQMYSSWPLPASNSDRPFTYVNFVMSHDGRVSFNEPGHGGGGDISRRDRHDRWLMGLLRARADAVLVGGSSIVAAGNHIWTPQAVFHEDKHAWEMLRAGEERAPVPLLVVLTRSGEVPEHAPALDNPDLPVLLATTNAGQQRARAVLGERAWVRYVVTGDRLEQRAVMQQLRAEGVQTLLCEGGPQIYASLLRDELIDDAFVTVSPIIVGADHEHERPSLVEGVAFPADQPPQLRLLSVHRHGSYVYLHSRYQHST